MRFRIIIALTMMMIIWWSELSWSSRYVIIKIMYIGTPCKQIWGLKKVFLFAKLEIYPRPLNRSAHRPNVSWVPWHRTSVTEGLHVWVKVWVSVWIVRQVWRNEYDLDEYSWPLQKVAAVAWNPGPWCHCDATEQLSDQECPPSVSHLCISAFLVEFVEQTKLCVRLPQCARRSCALCAHR